MGAVEKHLEHTGEEAVDGPSLSLAADVVEVRRNAGVAAAVGVLASALAIAFLARAVETAAVLDWVLFAVLGAIGTGWLASFVDARTPLLVADAQGVRLRLGRTWRGLPWSAVERVEHLPRRGLLRDGRLRVVPRNPDLLLAELDRSGSRQATLSTKLYGGPLALPLGLTTRVHGAGDDVAAALARLVDRGAEVVVLDEGPERPDEDQQAAALVAEPGADLVEDFDGGSEERPGADVADETVVRPRVRDPRPLLAGALSRVSARLPSRGTDEASEADGTTGATGDGPGEPDRVDEPEASSTPAAAREGVPASRAEVLHRSAEDETQVLPRARVELVEDDQTWGDRVRPIAREGQPVAPLVFHDFVVEPAADPVVGPELRAARTRLSLSVDQLAERTRIRPHVIEAIEVDDFVPCGGDFYARGHLRTLARVLGIDVAPLLTAYDERYAHAPIDPRRVFEAELATGSNGSIRATRGGPNWSILVAAVMALVLAWSVARLVMDSSPEVTGTPVLNGSGGPHGGSAVVADPVPVVISAPTGGARVVVRDSSGAEVFRGNLAIGESTEVNASPPLRVQTSDGAVTVVVDGRERGPVGEPGQAGQGTYAGG
ncbi:helix-turn-helix domain-containing protein [Nocardioides houyundeii]|uniref:helix-turn-helix domain-containing protein n=1 Tax=Nocardioides houyundeii TaxID=2045452 RepID=UPI000C7583D5|nr:helix-turn-helix domain-containing protein [Nocardioides houyundeii]